MTTTDRPFATIRLPTLNKEVVIHTRRQHAVGQGGFHTGALVAPQDASLIVSRPSGTTVFAGNAFRYVYDCGSRQGARCREVAKLYAQSAPVRRLDLLFLSHFDDDHVNGVPHLLHNEEGVRVDTIVMPWVDDVERLIAFARTRARSNPVERLFGRITTSRFFESLIIDPVETLSAFSPRRILFIQRGPSDPDSEPVELGPSGEGPEDSFRYKIRIDDSGGDRAPPRGSRSRHGSTEVVTLYDDAVIDVRVPTVAFSWLFKPYVRLADPARVFDFERKAEIHLGWPWGTFRLRVADPTVREDLVRNTKRAKALANAYKAAFRDRNLTSLCLYSGPSTEPAGRARLMVNLGTLRCAFASKIGWIGTGDALLRDPHDTQAFLTHYQAQQASVTTFGLPHHGALPNYSSVLVATLRPTTCVVSAKPPRNWRHPHPDVMADVVSQGAEAVQVSDTDVSAFEEAFIIVL